MITETLYSINCINLVKNKLDNLEFDESLHIHSIETMM